jgi:putative phosphoribosyl transferase
MFRNRTDAGQQLAHALKRYRETHPLVLGLPRGGVVVAAEIARALAGELDVMLVKKLRAPGQSELALGALSESGQVYLNPELVRLVGATREYLDNEIAERRAEISTQRRNYRRVRPQVAPAQRTVILVDDGLATGATMIAAIQALALARPARLVVAVPVSPPDTANQIAAIKGVDEFVCLETPWDFQGVGQFYSDFTQVDDETVLDLLRSFA